MLGKLLKYDLKWSIKLICIFLGLGFAFSVTGRLLDFVFNSLFFDIVVKICYGTSIALTINGLANSIIRSWVRFITNLYKDESYLTNTLPVKRSTHFLSKNLNSLICIVISMVALVVNVFIMYYSKEMIELIKTYLLTITTTLDMSVAEFIILLIAVLFVEILFLVEIGYFGIVFGYSHNNKKLLYSILYGIAGYAVSVVITFIILAIMSIFNNDLYNIIFLDIVNNTQTAIDFGLVKLLCVFAFSIYLVYTGLLYVIANAKLKKGINID